MSLVARQTPGRTQRAYCVEEPQNCLMRDTSWRLCYCSPPLRIINHNRSTWCWGKGFSRAGGGTPRAQASLLTKRVRTATSPCVSRAAPLSRLCLFPQHQLLPSLFSPAFNVPPSPSVNLLLQWHASFGRGGWESFLITSTASRTSAFESCTEMSFKLLSIMATVTHF